VSLHDGTVVRLRPMTAGDEPALRAFVEAISPESRRLRFCGSISPERAAALLTDCSCPGDRALIAAVPGARSIVAHAASYRLGPDLAEVAFLVADAWQGHGLGSLMLSRLAAEAGEQGVRSLFADVAPENGRMLTVFKRLGHPVQIRPDGGLVEVRISIPPSVPAPALAA